MGMKFHGSPFRISGTLCGGWRPTRIKYAAWIMRNFAVFAVMHHHWFQAMDNQLRSHRAIGCDIIHPCPKCNRVLFFGVWLTTHQSRFAVVTEYTGAYALSNPTEFTKHFIITVAPHERLDASKHRAFDCLFSSSCKPTSKRILKGRIAVTSHERHDVSNQRPFDCLFTSLYRPT